MKKIFETGIILFAVMGFWGMIYPDLCFTQDVCEIVYESRHIEKNEQETAAAGRISEAEEKDIFTQICEAEPERIRIKSRLLEVWSESKEK